MIIQKTSLPNEASSVFSRMLSILDILSEIRVVSVNIKGNVRKPSICSIASSVFDLTSSVVFSERLSFSSSSQMGDRLYLSFKDFLRAAGIGGFIEGLVLSF